MDEMLFKLMKKVDDAIVIRFLDVIVTCTCHNSQKSRRSLYILNFSTDLAKSRG